jgi:hypothetical protein
MGVQGAVDQATKMKLAALAAALAHEPGGIDSLVQKSYQFVQAKAQNVGVDEHGRRRLAAWGHKARREAVGGIL